MWLIYTIIYLFEKLSERRRIVCCVKLKWVLKILDRESEFQVLLSHSICGVNFWCSRTWNIVKFLRATTIQLFLIDAYIGYQMIKLSRMITINSINWMRHSTFFGAIFLICFQMFFFHVHLRTFYCVIRWTYSAMHITNLLTSFKSQA